MAERKIQTLTLGAITLLLHENILARGNKYNVMNLFTEVLCREIECTQGGW